MCLRKELGCVYDFSHPLILQQYGLAELWTCECFLRSELLANRRSQPSFSHLKGFSPSKTKEKEKKYWLKLIKNNREKEDRNEKQTVIDTVLFAFCLDIFRSKQKKKKKRKVSKEMEYD